ncbi:GMC oxidoreductase [Mangrovitalea sediminis]|uniref:GMC oxidoreductase n=1 Tax=Mangrovitalea sediminis TaxID=1982043 RepID=UPI000BE60D52|nr:GMC family oxidoreductase [Mangrovitalea sediminis]
MTDPQFDFIVIGSGFGGSVSALRLAEKGYRVAVLEQGKRVDPETMARAATDPRALFWKPGQGLHGFFSQDYFRHLAVVRGIGVGGGSLVYAGVLLRPGQAFFQSPEWRHLTDWESELAPHYEVASAMLGVTPNPRHGKMDEQLRMTAEALGCADSFGTVPQGIFFSETEGPVADPFFGGKGPARRPCNFCGHCVSGCAVGAKNSLDKNYLHLAEQLGVKLFPEVRAERIEPTPDGYRIVARSTSASVRKLRFRARKIVLAGGVLGTLELLFRCRDQYRTLPAISACLGQRVRTNSEALVASVSRNRQEDLSEGTTISSDFYFGTDTHITQNRLPPSHSLMRFLFGPMVDESRPFLRALKTLAQYLLDPVRATGSWRTDWYRRTTLLTVMQSLDNALDIRFERRWYSPWKKALQSHARSGQRAPTYIPKANQAARAFAEVSGGEPQSILVESVGNKSLTAHILGGACLGDYPENSVVDTHHRLHGYPDIYVADASAIPANIGVNPSLTITAMAERMASLIPAAEPAGTE